MSFCIDIDDDKLLEKYKTIWTQIKNSKNIEFVSLPVHDDIFLNTKVRTCDNKVYINFWWFKCARTLCRMRILYSYFYWFFTYL